MATLPEVRKHLQSLAQVNSTQLFEYCPPERLSHLGKLLDGKLFRGNVYHAILSIDTFLQKHGPKNHNKFVENQYLEVLEDSLSPQNAEQVVAEMVDRWLNCDEYYIVECHVEE